MRRAVDTTFGRYELRLYHSAAKARRFAARIGAGLEAVDGAEAQTDVYPEAIVVTLLADVGDPDELAALLVHEAVHAVQAVLREAGEDDPGDEEEAYLVQRFALALMEMHRAWARRHRAGS